MMKWAYFLEPLVLLALLVFIVVVAFLIGDWPQVFWRMVLMLGLAIALFGMVRLVRFLCKR